MDGQRRLEACVLLAPFAVVLLFKLAGGLGPQGTVAEPAGLEDDGPRVGTRVGAEDTIGPWIETLGLGPGLDSPMDHGPTPEVQVAVPALPVNPEVPIYKNPLAESKLTSVIGTGDEGVALIDGLIYRLGGEPAPGCIVVLIDARRQLVGVELATGEVFFIRTDSPEQGG